MGQFAKSIKANSETMKRLNAIIEVYKRNGRELEFRDKIAAAVYMAILDIETQNEFEKKEKLEIMDTLNKIICNYDNFKPIISKHIRNNITR